MNESNVTEYRPYSSNAPPPPPDRDSERERERQREILAEVLASTIRHASRVLGGGK